MAKAKAETTGIVRGEFGKILGPASEYEKKTIALRHEYEAVVQAAKELTVIDSLEKVEEATKLGRLLQTGTKEIELFFKPIKQAIDNLKSPVLAAEKQLKDMLETEKTRLGTAITVWNNKQRALREEEERKFRELAEQAAREDILSRACAAGDTEAAEAILDEPVMAPVVIQSVAPPKVQGQVAKFTYAVKIVDFQALVKAVIAGTAPWACIIPDEGYLNRKANLEKEGFSLAGCELGRKESTFFRS